LLFSIELEAQQLAALVAELSLERYRWLPKQLFLEFCLEAGVAVEVTLPSLTGWSMRGRRRA